MPSLKMKTKSSAGSVKEKYGLHVCLKSSVISKKSCSHVRISQQTAEFDSCSGDCSDGKQFYFIVLYLLLEDMKIMGIIIKDIRASVKIPE